IAHYETVRVSKQGQRINLSLSISPIRDSANRVVGASKVARDITERKQSEEALRHSQERLEIALEASGAVPWGWSIPENQMDEWSPQFRDFFGFSPEEPASFETWLRRIHPRDRGRIKA